MRHRYRSNDAVSGGYRVRRMRQSPQVPHFFGGPLENNTYSFESAADVCSENHSE